MNDKKKRPELLSAGLTLVTSFLATVVLHYCVMFLYFTMGRLNWFSVPFLDRAILYFPFLAMMYPGGRWLWNRRWVSGVLLLLAGWLVSFPALWIALVLIWKTFA